MAARLWGQQILVNTQLVGAQDYPAIATLNDGRLIVTWRETQSFGGDIIARLFNANGTPASGEFVIAGSADGEINPAVTALSTGGFAVAFETGVSTLIRRYDASAILFSSSGGTGVFPAIAGGAGSGVNAVARDGANLVLLRVESGGSFSTANVSTTLGNPGMADIAQLSDGRSIIVWVNNTGAVYGRFLESNGTLTPAFITVSSATTMASDTQPKVTALQNGASLVTWHGTGSGYPAAGFDVWGRIINAAGTPLGPAEMLINGRTTGTQHFPDIVGLKDGGFMVVWTDGAAFIRAQVFDPFGDRVGAEIVVNSGGTILSGYGLEATLMNDGRVAVVWNGSSGPGDTDGVFMQIIDPRDGYVEGTIASDTLYGHDALDDLVVSSLGADTIYAMGGNDTVYAGGENDKVYGGLGDDILGGGQGLDFVSGDAGNDLIYGDQENDTLGGGQGLDLIFGGAGDDWIEGGTEDDTLIGEGGGDRLEGQDGNDVLDGGPGNDVMIGGAGNDIIYMDSLGDQVIEQPGGGIDIVYSSAGWLGNANVENLVLTGNAPLNATMNNDANLVAGNGAANVIDGAGGNDTIDGLGGIDWLGGGDGADRLDGGADNDTIQGAVGADSLYGGSGADSFYYGSYLDSNAIQGIDSIQDFQVGVDKINLTPARLSASDSASIVYAYGNAYVFVDLYGDGINDMIIEVIGATTLSGSDLSFVAPAASAIYHGDDQPVQALTEAQQAAYHRGGWDALF